MGEIVWLCRILEREDLKVPTPHTPFLFFFRCQFLDSLERIIDMKPIAHHLADDAELG
jgi:hypothetical protein